MTYRFEATAALGPFLEERRHLEGGNVDLGPEEGQKVRHGRSRVDDVFNLS